MKSCEYQYKFIIINVINIIFIIHIKIINIFIYFIIMKAYY